jgi:hypothetical protein
MMSVDFKRFPNLIPMIWQLDGANASPGVNARRTLYGITNLPNSIWGGFYAVEGAAVTTVFQNYANAYDAIYSFSPAVIDFSFDYRPGSIYVTGAITLTDNLTTQNNKIVFIMTTQLAGVQNENYFALVIAYQDINFNYSTSGESQSFSISFNDLDTDLDMTKSNIVVMLQSFGETKHILQADSQRLTSILPPFSLRSFAGATQISLMWEPPRTEYYFEGFSISRDGIFIGTSTVDEPFFTDTNVAMGVSYTYAVSAIYADQLSTPAIVDATPTLIGYSQIGSGMLVNSTHEPSPINTTNRSLRSQFIYTAEELSLTGMRGPATISHIGFFIHNLPIFPLPNFRIRMKHTFAPDALYHDIGPFTTENIITSYSPVSGDFDMITLDEHFVWDGERNILVDTAFSPVPTVNSSGQMRIISESSGYRFIWHVSEDMTETATTTVLPYKPQIRIYHGQSVADYDQIVEKQTNISVSQNFPNPFNPNTNFTLVVHNPLSVVNISIYNTRGQHIRTLVEKPFERGEYSIFWDGTNNFGDTVCSGIYLFRVVSDGESITKKMVMLK